MNNTQKEIIDLIVQYTNANDWESVKVVIQGQFLDAFDSINSDLLNMEEEKENA
jgi:hypothetical protein